jgi:hypothetical protein
MSKPSRGKRPLIHDQLVRGASKWARAEKTPLEELIELAADNSCHFYGYIPKEDVIALIRRTAATVDGDLRAKLETLAREFDAFEPERPCATREMIDLIYALVA